MSFQPAALGRQLARLARNAERALARVLGVPDYERYAAHMRAAHPDAAPLSAGEFLNQRLSERYSKPGARCC